MYRKGDREAYPHSDEEGLVREILSGDRSAFDLLVRYHEEKVFTLCLRITGSYDDAGDCAQETFIRAYRGLASFKFRSSLGTWLYRIAVNTCRSFLDRQKRKGGNRQVSIDGGDGYLEEKSSLEIVNGSGNPELLYERSEEEAAILGAVASLPENQRTLIVLRDMEGKSYEEISEITGVGKGTVKSRISRARDKLRELLKDELFREYP